MRALHQAGLTVSGQLDAIGYDRRRLLGVLPTHSHGDHVSGLDGLHGTPIWMNANEREYAAGDPDGKVYRSVSQGHEIEGIRRRVERPWVLSKLADSDPEMLRQGLRRMIALDGLMQIVPAHDLDSYQGIALLSAQAAGRHG